MDADDDVVVIVWQHQILQFAHAVPLAGTYDNRASWIGFADFGNCFGINRIQNHRFGGILRLVQKFKYHSVGQPGVAGRHLPPNRDEFIGLSDRIAGKRVEMVDVQHHRQPT